MGGYVTTPGYAKSVATVTDNRNLLMSSCGRTTSQKAESKIINGSVVSGLLFAALLAFMNLGSSTTPSHSNLNAVKTAVIPAIIRTNADGSEDDGDSIANASDALQELFGLNTAQWAKILKVERKTVYNWRKSPETKIKASAAERINVLQKFAEEFNPAHKDFFSKFLFGKKAEKKLLDVFLKEPLSLEEMLNQYDSIYTKLDGLVKRKALFGE